MVERLRAAHSIQTKMAQALIADVLPSGRAAASFIIESIELLSKVYVVYRRQSTSERVTH